MKRFLSLVLVIVFFCMCIAESGELTVAAVEETDTITLSSEITTGVDLANRAKYVALNYKTLYVMGGWGAPLTEANKQRYINGYAYNQSAQRQNYINAASSDTFAFDCVCFIKALLWGWTGDVNASNGGSVYASNGVPDISADQMIDVCSDISSDFSNVEIGELLWTSGHVGIYIGNGLAVECTPSWTNNVQITACNQSISGYNTRYWIKHGKLPYVDYVYSETDEEFPYTDLILDFDMNLISSVGHQDLNGYACSCFALAYARTITDKKVHYYSEYNIYGATQYNVSCQWSRGAYYGAGVEQKNTAFRSIYNALIEGRPAIAQVNGSPQHYVTVVGFENVTSLDTLNATNFLIIDPAGNKFELENMAEAGYDMNYFISADGSNNHYQIILPEGYVPQVEFSTKSPSKNSYFDYCSNYQANVRVAITENCNPHPLPCSNTTAQKYGSVSQAITDKAFSCGDEVTAIGIYKNTEDHYWYEIVLDDGTTAYVFADHTEMLNPVAPWVDGGWFYANITGATALNGTVRTSGMLDYVQAVVYKGNNPYGTVAISSNKVYVGGNSYALKGSAVDNTLYFQNLTDGYYTLAIEAEYSSYYVEDGELSQTGMCSAAAYYNFSFGSPGGCSHSYGTQNISPSCNQQGYTIYTCLYCGDSYTSNYVDSLGCDYYTDKIEPGCNQEGYTLHTCYRCGNSYTSDYVDSLGHYFGKWYEVYAPTCNEYGEYQRECTSCLLTQTTHEDIQTIRTLWVTRINAQNDNINSYDLEGGGVIYTSDYNGGAWWIHVAFAPTSNGMYEIVDISDGIPNGNGRALDIPYGGFVWAANYGNDYLSLGIGDIDYKNPGANACIAFAKTWEIGDRFFISGIDFNTSSIPTSTPETPWYDDNYVCTAEIVQVVYPSASGHNYSSSVIAPTCTVQGYTVYTCSSCHTSYKDSYVPAAGHSYGNWYATKNATCTSKGEARRDCNNCSHYLVYEVDATGHSYSVVDTEPTCTEQGYTTYTCDCGDSYIADYVSALGHTHGKWVTVVEPEVGKEGKKEQRCEACGEVLAEKTIPALDPEYTLGDVNNDGDIDKYDYILVKRHCMGTYTLEGIALDAADVNRDGDIDKYDYILIKRHCMGTYTIAG